MQARGHKHQQAVPKLPKEFAMAATLFYLNKRRRRRRRQPGHLNLLGFVCSALFFLDRRSFAFVFSPLPFIRLAMNAGSLSRPTASSLYRPVQSKEKISGDDEIVDDKILLSTVEKQQLVKLCLQLQLPTKGTKETLLKRLRTYADEKAEMERQILLERARRVEERSDDAKERYEIIDEADDDDEIDVFDDGFFFFELPDHAINITNKQEEKPKPKKPTSIPNSVVTAPPPPEEPNEKGERVVTVYSTTDQNDLTGIAAAQPGQAAMANDNLMTVGSSSNPANQPWDMQQNQRGRTTSKETEQAKETVVELVTILLAMSGAPAFSSVVGDEDLVEKIPSYIPSDEFVGFDPSKVPTELLIASSQALRTGRGQVLDEVIRQFELQAIGQDGMAGDDVEKGGGHYREVTKVRAFLDGYRRAEVRRLARETAAMLLDKLVLEGVEGLDMMLASMTRSGDDNAAFSGELNDSLLDYLNSAIRQQEQKVDELVVKRSDKTANEEQAQFLLEECDEIDALWNVTEEDGKQVETIDPNDPKVYNVLQREQQKSEQLAASSPGPNIPETAPEQLLLLLTLLRERIKAEAAFGPDEKGRNLRLLAYCLRLKSDPEREQLVLKEVGNSLDRLDSFRELVASSIEYGESTSYELQPAKTKVLNVKQLRNILDLIDHLRGRQAWKASGLS